VIFKNTLPGKNTNGIFQISNQKNNGERNSYCIEDPSSSLKNFDSSLKKLGWFSFKT